MNSTAAIVATLTAAATTSTTLAQVETFRTIKARNYTQTDNTQPVSADFYGYVHDLFSLNATLTPENVGVVTVTRPDGVVNDLIANPAGNFVTFFGPTFATEAELDAAVPAGDYVFDIDGGNFGPQTGTISQVGFNPWNAVPFATNFDQLQDADPGQDLTILFDRWMPDAATTPGRSGIFWSLIDLDTNAAIEFDTAPLAATSITLDGDNLTPGNYRVILSFSARIEDADAGFDGAADASQAFDSNTAIDFNVIPTPASAALLALPALAAARRRR